MKVLKYPIIIITFFFAAGIAIGYYLNLSLVLLAETAAAAFIALAIAFWQAKKALVQKPWFGICTFLFSLVAGMVTQALHYHPNHSTHYSHLLTDETPVIKGVISERLKPDAYTEKYYFEVLSVNNHDAAGKILLTVARDSLAKKLHAGDSYIIVGTPQSINPALNPNQFDYAAYMQKQDVFHQLRLKNYIAAGTLKNFDYYIGRLRDRLTGSFAMHKFSPKVQHTLDALLLGQRQDMEKQLSDQYKNAGVLHILAISGLHFAVLFYVLTRLLRPLGRLRKGRLLQLVAILLLLWGFALATGLSASVVRSVVMFTFVGAGYYFNRNANIYNSLAVSMLVLLLAKPNFLFDAGFQLSYLAVFSIVWLQPLYSKVRKSKYKAVNYITDTLLISLAAQIGVLPLSLYYFGQFPLLFLMANLIVIPLSNAVLVLGLLVLLLNFIFPQAALWLGKVLEFIVLVMNSFIEWIASFDSLVLKDIPFTLVLNLSLYAVIIAVVLWLHQKSYRRTAVLLCSVMVFQLAYTITAYESHNGEELIIFNDRKSSLLAIRKQKEVIVFSTDSTALNLPAITAYGKANFSRELSLYPMQNLLWVNGEKILVIDSDGLYGINCKPDILILSGAPKVNLERALGELQPAQVIADGTNYKSNIARWEATCHKLKIPFHATAEKGFYRINK